MSNNTLDSRRRFLVSAAAGVATGAAAVAAPAVATDTTTLTMVTTWPKGAPGIGVNAQRFADRVGVMSGGRLKIKFFAAGELVPPFEALDAVEQGVADLVHSSPYYWVGKAKTLHYFTGIPFGMTAAEFSAWLYFGGGQELWERVYAPFNVLPFYAGSSGTQAGGWFNKEINSLTDLKGLKFRIAGLGGEVMKRLGVTPVMTPPGEIAPSLASGAVDGADWVGPWNDIAFGLHKFAKYYYMPGFHEPGPGLEVLVNKDVYNKLSKDLRAILQAAAQATAIETLSDFTFHNVQSFDALLKRYGVQIRSFSVEIVNRFREVSFEVLEELGRADPLTKQVHESYMDFWAKATIYAPRGEQGFLNMRISGA